MNSEKVFFKNQSNVRFLLITANTGTVFEKPDLLTPWVTEFANLIRNHPADFIALHCQEVGGKDYERYMQVIDPFTKNILEIPEIANEFTSCRIYFDSDYTSQDTFTALGSAYFIRQSLPIQQWNFTTSSFENVNNRQIYSGNLTHAQTVRQEKFPRDFFSESKWSRKGFTQTRWSINDFIFDMVNVHLFHDASNILAVEQSPSIYSEFRKNALKFTLNSLPLNDAETPVPYAIFGDFNFRLDGHRLLQHIAEKRNGCIDKIKHPNNEEISKIIIKNSQNKPKLTIAKKEFNLHDDHDTFFSTDICQFRNFDFEFSSFADQLFEYEKNFPPSYPYSEEYDEARLYLRVRCPAWCDRVFLSHSFKNLTDDEINQPTYCVAGADACMGDHKPVYLAVTIRTASGWFPPSPPLMTNTYLCEAITTISDAPDKNTTNNNNYCNDTKSSVTVMRNNHPDTALDFILNGVELPTHDINNYNIHDYASFVEPAHLPQWWYAQLQQRPTKILHNSTKLWAKVRAITYMTGLGHRAGSWYSDDQTEISPLDDVSVSSSSNGDENKSSVNIKLNDLEDLKKPDLVIPLRRSFSTNAYVIHDEIYPLQMTRSCSTTLINPTDDVSFPSHVEHPPVSTPPPASSIKSQSPHRSSSRVYRFLRCIIL